MGIDSQGVKKRTPILTDYKKVGSTFIPPMIHKLGPWVNASYSRQTLPELIWWDVIANKISAQFSIDLAGEIGAHFKDRKEPRCWWAFVSDYSHLTDDEFENLRNHLSAKGLLNYLQHGMSDFLEVYPKCPLKKFLDSPPAGVVDVNYLASFEKQLSELEDKRSKPAVLMQAQVVYLGFVMDRLKVFKGLALADFPEVSKYPDTQRSKEVGASICACVNMMAAQMLPNYPEDIWALYFWSRSYELKPIRMSHLLEAN